MHAAASFLARPLPSSHQLLARSYQPVIHLTKLFSTSTLASPSFLQLGVDPGLVDALARQGVLQPSPIQSAAIPEVLSNKSCAIQSCTGSGKTLSYVLPLLTLIRRRLTYPSSATPPSPRPLTAPTSTNTPSTINGSSISPTSSSATKLQHPAGLHAVVVAPSHELCIQIMHTAQGLLPPEAKDKVQQLIGNANGTRQREAIKRHKPWLVVGTPGRLLEMIRSEVIMVGRCPTLVMDEADHLLDAHFLASTQELSKLVGRRLQEPRQTVLVSASLTRQGLQQATSWLPPAEVHFISAAAKSSASTPTPAASSSKHAIGVSATDPTLPTSEPTSSTVAASPGSQSLPAAGSSDISTQGAPPAPAAPPAPQPEPQHDTDQAHQALPILPPHLKHYYVISHDKHRTDKLRRVVHALGVQRALVFMNYQRRLMDAVHKLEARHMEVTFLHGSLPKLARMNVLNAFRRGNFRALVVSDVVARGLDVPDCDAVFNLELCEDALQYAHRAGRTGRLGGAEGVVVSIIPLYQVKYLKKIAKRLNIELQAANVAYGDFITLTDAEAERQAGQEALDSSSNWDEAEMDGPSRRAAYAQPGLDRLNADDHAWARESISAARGGQGSRMHGRVRRLQHGQQDAAFPDEGDSEARSMFGSSRFSVQQSTHRGTTYLEVD